MPFLLLLKNSTVIEPLSSIDMFVVECNSIVFVTIGTLFVALCSSVYWSKEQAPGNRSAMHNEELMVCIPGIIKTLKFLRMQ